MSEFGLIETIKVVNGRPVFRNLHVKRLHRGLKLLQIDESEYKLEDRILRLLKYECVSKGLKNIRLRIEVQKNRMHEYMPDISPLKWNCTLRPLDSDRFLLNDDGLKLTLFSKYKKPLDIFMNLKHTDRGLYDKALEFARLENYDEAVILNEHGTVADASIYNVFVVKDGQLSTPPLTDGPVAGVLRELLLTRLVKHPVLEKTITLQDLYSADEIFLTNAVKGIRWVSRLDDRFLASSATRMVFEEFKTVVTEHFGEHLV
jgi:branched-chain amino acid aminotransferase